MGEYLTQEEIDALLKGIEGEEEEKEEQPQEGIIPYDITSHERVVWGRLPGLEMALERVGRTFRNEFSLMLNKMIDVRLLNVEITKFADFIKTLPVPSSIHIIKMILPRSEGLILVTMDARIVFSTVEVMLGGDFPDHVKVEGRDFTNVELAMAKRVVNIFLKGLAESWRPISKVDFQYVRSEMIPQFAAIAQPTNAVILGIFEIEMGDIIGKLNTCIPYILIEPVKDKLQAGYQSDTIESVAGWKEKLAKLLEDVSVEVRVDLGKTRMPLEDFLKLKKGDVIVLDRHTTDELDVRVQGVLKFKGVPGVKRGDRAVKITKKIEGELGY